MKTITAKLKSISAYSQSKHYVVDKLPGENHIDYVRRTWRNYLHAMPDGTVFIPPMAFKNCLGDAAAFRPMQIPGKGKTTYTKHFDAGVLVIDPLILPLKVADAEHEWLFLPSDGKPGSGSRVDKCYPVIHEWAGDVLFRIFDEIVLNACVHDPKMSVFEYHLREAGMFIGIGRFRPRKRGYYGRFEVVKVSGL